MWSHPQAPGHARRHVMARELIMQLIFLPTSSSATGHRGQDIDDTTTKLYIGLDVHKEQTSPASTSRTAAFGFLASTDTRRSRSGESAKKLLLCCLIERILEIIVSVRARFILSPFPWPSRQEPLFTSTPPANARTTSGQARRNPLSRPCLPLSFVPSRSHRSLHFPLSARWLDC